MAKMQKKKPTGQKKTGNKTGDSAAGDSRENGVGSSLTSSGNSKIQESGAKQQKTGVSASKRPPGEQTFLIRLLDRYFGSWFQFLREVRNELSKVVWPTKKEATGMTAVVLVFVLIISLYLGIIDFGLSSLVRIIL